MGRKQFVMTHKEIAYAFGLDGTLYVPPVDFRDFPRAGQDERLNCIRYHNDRQQIVAIIDSERFPEVPVNQQLPIVDDPVMGPRDFSQMTREQLLQAKEDVLTALYDLDHPRRT